TKVSVMRKILNSRCLMTSHGPGIFCALRWLSSTIRFVDVWHGIPGVKHESPEKFGRMRFYSAFFVSSEYLKEIYVKQYQFEPHQVIVTGHSRVDRFCDPDGIAQRVRRELDLTNTKYVILLAPTYRPAGEPGEIPFGLSCTEFLSRLNGLCEKIDATLIFRLHINSRLHIPEIDYSRIRVISQKEYPEANELLTAVDLVITDWSSIACDFYTLARPVVYIDNPKPSTHEGGYQKIERVGDHVKNIDDLLVAIEQNLALDKDRVREMLCGVIKNCYGNTLDGNSAQRYDTAIRELLQIN
ncbi:MAG: CDP-glycerol glycerophosphotransferase family protein, partial [Planctomycetota bacterium]